MCYHDFRILPTGASEGEPSNRSGDDNSSQRRRTSGQPSAWKNVCGRRRTHRRKSQFVSQTKNHRCHTERGEEIKFLQRSNFGKLTATSERPSFSGSYSQYITTMMLKVSKKHEIWFLLVGKPIRVSIREFAIVTGLPCGKYPRQSKKKTNLLKQKTVLGGVIWITS